MTSSLVTQVFTALAKFTSDSRLYELAVGGDQLNLGSGGLLVEAFAADEQLQMVGSRDVIALSTNAHIVLGALLGRPATLKISLANRTRANFHGFITEIDLLGSNGGLARYRLRLSPWLWQLSQVRNSRVWEEKTVTEIIDSVFAAYLPLAQWRWSSEVDSFLTETGVRSYCCQYRETDLDFVTRLLTGEGLAWRVEDGKDGHCVVLFADSTRPSAVPEDASSAEDGGIRYQAARAAGSQDGIQALTTSRAVTSANTTVLSYDFKTRKIVTASVATQTQQRVVLMPEHFDAPGQGAFASSTEAGHYALLHAQALEARAATCTMRSTVRTLRAGTRFSLLDGPFTRLSQPAYTVLRVRSVGVNNLPVPAVEGLAELFGPIPELLDEALPVADDYRERAISQAQASGYANWFDAIAAELPWRPLHADDSGKQRSHPKPTARGSQSAIVVGPNGKSMPNGADELYCDALGRIRIRFHWQDQGGCWVRVGQRLAGAGMGFQFLPRIGQEVIVQFLENDIDQPVVVGALYNGQGEGGVAPTPAGKFVHTSDGKVFDVAHDHAVSAQGNLAGGNSPVWHGAPAAHAGHHNAAAQWGLRSKEFGGRGYNQLLFDDTDDQGRVQLRSTHAASELNLGHLIHSADNYRGSFRGHGAELRTDGYGAVRAGAGLLVSSYRIGHAASGRDPAGDNVAGIALLKQAVKLGEVFSGAAQTHETVGLAAHLGSSKAGASVLDENAAPLKALLTAVSGMVGSASVDAATKDAAAKSTDPGEDKLPHVTAPVIAVSAKSGLGVTAGQSVQLASGETVTLMSGQDTQFVTGGPMRVHSGQAFGVLGGAVKAGEGGLGLQMIAAQGAVELQAQSDVLKIQARDLVNVISSNAHVDWAAAKRISLSTADGANITIEGGNITVQCPGKITVHAGKKSFTGPDELSYAMPGLARSICVACLRKSLAAAPAFTTVE